MSDLVGSFGHARWWALNPKRSKKSFLFKYPTTSCVNVHSIFSPLNLNTAALTFNMDRKQRRADTRNFHLCWLDNNSIIGASASEIWCHYDMIYGWISIWKLAWSFPTGACASVTVKMSGSFFVIQLISWEVCHLIRWWFERIFHSICAFFHGGNFSHVIVRLAKLFNF